MALSSGITVTLNKSRVEKAIFKLSLDVPKIVGAAMYTTGFAVLRPYGQQLLRKNKTIYSGALRQKLAVRSKVATEAEGLPTIQFGSFGVAYGIYVEEGSKPRSVSRSEFTNLILYMHRTILKGERGDDAEAQAIALAQAAADTIEREGNKAHPFLMPTWKANKNKFWKGTFKRIRASMKKKHGTEG